MVHKNSTKYSKIPTVVRTGRKHKKLAKTRQNFAKKNLKNLKKIWGVLKIPTLATEHRKCIKKPGKIGKNSNKSRKFPNKYLKNSHTCQRMPECRGPRNDEEKSDRAQVN